MRLRVTRPGVGGSKPSIRVKTEPDHPTKPMIANGDVWSNRIQAFSSLGLLGVAVYGFFFSPMAQQAELDYRSQLALQRQEVIELRNQKADLDAQIERREAALSSVEAALRQAETTVHQTEGERRQLAARFDSLAHDRAAILRSARASLSLRLKSEIGTVLAQKMTAARCARDLEVIAAWVDKEHLEWLALEAGRLGLEDLPLPSLGLLELPTYTDLHLRSREIQATDGPEHGCVDALWALSRTGVRPKSSIFSRTTFFREFFSEEACTKAQRAATIRDVLSGVVARVDLSTLPTAEQSRFREDLILQFRVLPRGMSSANVCATANEPHAQISRRASQVYDALSQTKLEVNALVDRVSWVGDLLSERRS